MVENESVDSSLSASGEKVTPKKVKIHCPYNNPEDLLVDVDKLSLFCERFRQHFGQKNPLNRVKRLPAIFSRMFEMLLFILRSRNSLIFDVMIQKCTSSIREMVEYVIMLPKKCIERKIYVANVRLFFPSQTAANGKRNKKSCQ